MDKIFICYRGGSSAGEYFANDLYDYAYKAKNIIGDTYFSCKKNNIDDNHNYETDPDEIIPNVDYFILLLTKDFFNGFLVNGEINEESITRKEIDCALKNTNLRFIQVLWPDFNWNQEAYDGFQNKDILTKLWGEEAMKRIKGSLPLIHFNGVTYKEDVIKQVLNEISHNQIPESLFRDDIKYELESLSLTEPKKIFYGREKELEEIKELFNAGEHIIFLQGIGGIGKTQIALQYAKLNKESYDTIVYATYNNSILDLIISQQSAFRIKPELPRLKKDDGTIETDLEYFMRKVDIIKNNTNERTLIIIDNYDVLTDEHFSDLTKNSKFHLLITTRCDYSKLCKTIKIESLDSIDALKRIFLDNYEGYLVDEDDPHLEELINLVNKHTYTVELIAQHMENSGQSTEEMIEVLKEQGIISLTETVRQSTDESSIAYENLIKMFKVFELNDEDKAILKILSLMPLRGVDVKDLKNWLGINALKTIRNLETRSWLVSNVGGIALHPVIRDVVRHELGITLEEAKDFLKAFNETIKEEKSWHYPIDKKTYYGDIGLSIIEQFNELNDDTLELYKNVEVVLSFEVKPAKAVELCSQLYNYFLEKNGNNNTFMCAYYSFQAGWCYLFNLFLPNAFLEAKKWFDISYPIFKNIELNTEEEFAVYGHLLTHMARVILIYYGVSKEIKLLDKAKEYAEEALVNANAHFQKGSPFYSRIAVADMQLAEVLMAYKEYEKALSLLTESYDIVSWMFGDDDPDSVNVSCRKSAVLYRLGRYQEALDLGYKNLDKYTRYYGELNSLRFEQLIIVYRCVSKLNDTLKIQEFKDEIIKVSHHLLTNSSNMLEEILNS